LRVAAEVDRRSAVLVVEHGPEFEACAELFEVMTQRRHAHVVGVLGLGDRPLLDVESAGEFGLADRLAVSKLVQPDLLERLGTQSGEPLDSAGLGDHGGAEFGELGSCHQINPSSPSSRR
jgi:hypothetical protein